MLKSSILEPKLPYTFKCPDMVFKWVLDIVELIAVLASIPLSYYISKYIVLNFKMPFYNPEFKHFILRYFNYYNLSWHFDITQFALFSIIILISWYILSQLTLMAKVPGTQRYLTVIFQFLRGNLIILFVLLAFKFILNLSSISIIFIFTYIAVSLIFTLTIRIIFVYKLRIYRTNGHNVRYVILIAEDGYENIINSIINQKDWGFRIACLMTKSPIIKMKYGLDFQIFSEEVSMKYLLDNFIIDEVLYCKKNVDEKELSRVAEICNEVGVILRLQSGIHEIDPVIIQLKTINQNGNLALVDTPALKLPLFIKTMTDLYLSIIAVILLLPIFLIIALIIKLDSKGPVFFKQERIGIRGRKFKLYKFRTMVFNAEEQLKNLKEKNEMDGPTFKIKSDPRITKLGKLLRKNGLDELPQLINVIKGEMSLIGPRPPLESEVILYKRWQLRRLSVKPGITCTWQIMPNRNDVKFEEWMQMDLNYIDKWSLNLDFKLFFMTIPTMIISSGR